MSAGLSAWQLAEIRARLERARTTAGCGRWADGEYEVIVAALGDVPALLAEAERLTKRVADLDAERHTTNKVLFKAALAARDTELLATTPPTT